MSKNSKHVYERSNYCNANNLHNTSWTSKVLKEKKIMNTIHDKRKGISDPLQSKGQWSSMVISSNLSMGTVRNRQGTTIADGLGLGGGITVCTPSILLPSGLCNKRSVHCSRNDVIPSELRLNSGVHISQCNSLRQRRSWCVLKSNCSIHLSISLMRRQSDASWSFRKSSCICISKLLFQFDAVHVEVFYAVAFHC